MTMPTSSRRPNRTRSGSNRSDTRALIARHRRGAGDARRGQCLIEGQRAGDFL